MTDLVEPITMRQFHEAAGVSARLLLRIRPWTRGVDDASPVLVHGAVQPTSAE